MAGNKPGPKEAWDILMEVSERLHEEEDSKGDLRDTGEARALSRMKGALEREIAKDASEFLRQRGFTSTGQRVKPGQKRRGRR